MSASSGAASMSQHQAVKQAARAQQHRAAAAGAAQQRYAVGRAGGLVHVVGEPAAGAEDDGGVRPAPRCAAPRRRRRPRRRAAGPRRGRGCRRRSAGSGGGSARSGHAFGSESRRTRMNSSPPASSVKWKCSSPPKWPKSHFRDGAEPGPGLPAASGEAVGEGDGDLGVAN